MPVPVDLYTTSWCPDCARMKRVLKLMGAPFREIDIEEVEGAEAEMRRRNGGSGKVPTVVLGDMVLIEPSESELKRAAELYVASVSFK